jgi:hypothetical protein
MHEALIVGCSDRKRGFTGPAILVYDGPLHQVLRLNLPRVDLFFFSALHGLIRAEQRIEPYDLPLAQTSLTIPQLGNQWLDLHLNRYSNIYACLTPAYDVFLSPVIAEYHARGVVFRVGEGQPIGKKAQTLKTWCLQKQGDVPAWIKLCLNGG